MTKAIALKGEDFGLKPEQIELMKNTICKGGSDHDLELLIHTANRLRLDPLAKQIYSVPRGNTRTIQVSVDGFRLIADRTGKYMPGKEPSYTYDEKGRLISSTAYIKKMDTGGGWHEISATAFLSEFDGGTNLWKKMPHIMLAKVAECQALRKGFPADLSGVYADEEMEQAEVEVISSKTKIETLSPEQAAKLLGMVGEHKEYMDRMLKHYKASTVNEIPAMHYNTLIGHVSAFLKAKEEDKKMEKEAPRSMDEVAEAEKDGK